MQFIIMAVPVGTVFGIDQRLLDGAEGALPSGHLESINAEPSVRLIQHSLEAASLGDERQSSDDRSGSAGTTCLACRIGVDSPAFATADEQRAHFKTDWHRYNVKRRLAGLPHATETQFLALIENDDDRDEVGSLSGSESEASDDDDEQQRETSGAGASSSGPQCGGAWWPRTRNEA